MPVEIKELHIKVTVNAPQSPAPPAQQSAGQSTKGGDGGGDKDAIVAECVEQVLQILQDKRER